MWEVMAPLLTLLLLLEARPSSSQLEVSTSVGSDGAPFVAVLLNGRAWLEEREGLSRTFMRKDDTVYERDAAPAAPAAAAEQLAYVDRQLLAGSDALGSYRGRRYRWSADGEQIFNTGFREYGDGDVVVFSQEFTNQRQVRQQRENTTTGAKCSTVKLG